MSARFNDGDRGPPQARPTLALGLGESMIAHVQTPPSGDPA